MFSLLMAFFRRVGSTNKTGRNSAATAGLFGRLRLHATCHQVPIAATPEIVGWVSVGPKSSGELKVQSDA
jgi:hypothetical protein